ncbi:MAG: hypothetical protein ACRDUX_29915 [Mycobacterium sp.]
MRAPLEICRKRTVCAVLASGVVISLTALTGGIAPAFAAPHTDPGGPTTTVAPQPTVEAPKQAPERAPEKAPVEKPTVADIPSTVEPSPVTVAPSVPETVEAPPQTRAPEPSQTVEAPTETRAPEKSQTVETPTETQAPEPAPSTPVPVVTTTRQAPSSTATSAAPPTSHEAPSSSPPAPATSATQSTPTPEEQGSTNPTPSTSSPATSAGESTESSSESTKTASVAATTSASSAVESTRRVVQKVAPQTLEAPDADVEIAQSAKIVEEKPVAAPKQEIDDISRVIDLPNRDNRDKQQPFDKNGQRDRDQVRLAGDDKWDRNVRQWRPDWVQYDEYYRPVLSNPYRDPVRIVYVYQNAPRIVWIPPLARIVLEVAQYAAYSFTALVTNPINQVANVAVGSFFGGGYYPGAGLPLPPPPPPLLNYANVPVHVRYSDADYEPFRVSKIVDVGDDAQYGERKVLLDGVTPAWGEWKQTPSGERSFEVHKTQQFPGLDDPQEAPLPGDYQLKLASDESSSGMNKRDVYLIAVAVACGALSIGAVVLSVFIGRRRRPLH